MGNIKVSTFTNSNKDLATNVLSSSQTYVENLIGSTSSASTFFSKIFSGGFTGMSETGMTELKNQLNSYCQGIQDLIAGFDQTGDISSALKGNIQTAAYDFIEAIKKLLQAYVSTMKQELDEVDQAYQNFIKSGQSVSQDVTTAADDIRSNASSISLD